METTLHRQLKEHYASSPEDVEVTMGRYRIDAIRGDELIEVQCASLSAIRDKAAKLLKRHPLRVVKPIVHRTRILKSKTKTGKITSRRMSPKRGELLDVFEDLIYFTRVFPHPNLTIEVPLVHVSQHRVPADRRRRRRWKVDYRVADVILESIDVGAELRTSQDLLALVDWPTDDSILNTADLAKRINKPRWVAQKIAYVLRKTGALTEDGRDRKGVRYRAATSPTEIAA